MTIHSIKRAILYGFLLWFVWTTIVVVAYETLPTAIAGSAFFVSMKTVLLAMLTMGLAVRYMKKAGPSAVLTAREGLVIGLIWVATMIIFDISHYLFMAPPFDPGKYFFMFATSYILIPFVTVVLFGRLRLKTT